MSDVMEINVADLQYHVLPSKRWAGSSFAKTHDAVFNFFVDRWEEAFNAIKDQGSMTHGWEDHFLKQDMITAITHKNEVIAVHLYTIYDLSSASTRRSEYFSFLPKNTIPQLLEQGIQNVTTMEYLCVAPKAKKNTLGTSFGKIILGLGGYLTEDKGLDGSVGTPLKDNKVDVMMENVGGILLAKDVMKYEFRVDLMIIPTTPCERSRDPRAGEIMDFLWKNRLDYTKEFFSRLAS